ncbi:MAG TPA: adenosylmethionine decarboxylase [Armatimonadota bacterium]|nr:adenosylmethionine decarboxylase [Armatimonadota bacterium]
MHRVGRHLILELWGCDKGHINSIETIERAIKETIEACGATLLDLRVYPFTPQGVTGVAILSESHLMIHTWPEYGYAAVDVFTCGYHTDPSKAVPVLRRYFTPERVQVMEMNRGLMLEDETKMEAETEYAAVR